MLRQIILDTETTGIDPKQGHRIIEIGCVEMINRRFTGNNFHEYLQPDREIEAEAIEVHGITNESLADKPRFPEIAQAFMDYVQDAELIIHNAPFDIGFLNHELRLMNAPWQAMQDHCRVLDTLVMARRLFPGQKNNLDALCRRYTIDNSHRVLHGALLDSEILGDVYLMMTGGQVALQLDRQANTTPMNQTTLNEGMVIQRLSAQRKPLPIIRANADEQQAHQERVAAIQKKAGQCLWRTFL
ncbi:MAG: DNA polymerase III subunit epsilon [bacterium]